MKKFIILFIFISFFTNCSQEKPQILDEEEFVNLLVDIHTADALLSELKVNDKKIKGSDSLSYYNFIFIKYDINRKQFDDNIDYYWKNTKKYQAVYDKVLIILTEKRELLDSLEVEKKSSKLDSK